VGVNVTPEGVEEAQTAYHVYEPAVPRCPRGFSAIAQMFPHLGIAPLLFLFINLVRVSLPNERVNQSTACDAFG
jgi:hypothetical protein